MNSNSMTKYFHLVPGNPVFPKPPVQANLPDHAEAMEASRQLYLRSCARFPAIVSYLRRKLIKGTGCKLKLEDDAPGAGYHFKTITGIRDKAQHKYNSDVAYVTDPLRFRITFNTYAQYDKISNKLLPVNHPGVLEYEPGIRFPCYDKGGFAADQIIMNDPESGLCYELQITHEAFDIINRPTHEKYEVQRAAEKRAHELQDQWRLVAQADMIRRAMNDRAGKSAQLDSMRYDVTFGISPQDGQTPFAAIWPCRADRQKHARDPYYALTPKYVLTPYQASGCLFHNPGLQQDIADAGIEDRLHELPRLKTHSDFSKACQHYLGQHRAEPEAIPKGPKL